MSSERRILLGRIRTDGWFERLSESIGSFHTLCDVLGERFFALALVVGARVSSLMIDRFNPDHSLVEFAFGGFDDTGASIGDDREERLTVLEFRQRLVQVLKQTPPQRAPLRADAGEDPEALQKHVGPRLLLLAPLYGYRLEALLVKGKTTRLEVDHEGQVETFEIEAFWKRLQQHVEEDLERGVPRERGTAIDLNCVADAELAAAKEDWDSVVELLGSWPLPLAIYWRTPEGQMLPEQHRQRIAEGLGLLGTACAKLGDEAQGEEVLRLAVQYAQDGPAAPSIFKRIAKRFVESERHGEAIAPLRRAHTLGGPTPEVMVDLATVLFERKLVVGALGCVREAEAAGVPAAKLKRIKARINKKLGGSAKAWRKLVDKG